MVLLLILTTRSGTKTDAGTNAGTTFLIVLNEMSGVPAFTPIFRSNVLVNKPFQIPSAKSNAFAVGLGLVRFDFANYWLITNCCFSVPCSMFPVPCSLLPVP